MSDTTIKNMVYIIAALLSIYPLLEIFRKQKKWVKGMLIIVLIFFWYITIRYKSITDTENKTITEKANKSDSANKESQKEIKELKAKADITNQYLQAIKDSLKSNKSDKNKTILNYINKVETLNQ